MQLYYWKHSQKSWVKAVLPVLKKAEIECRPAEEPDTTTYTGRIGGFRWLGEPTAEEHAAIEQALGTGADAVLGPSWRDRNNGAKSDDATEQA